MTPILRRDGSAHSADSAGKVKVCAVATTKSSGRFHHRGAEYIALSSIFADLCVLRVSAVGLFFDLEASFMLPVRIFRVLQIPQRPAAPPFRPSFNVVLRRSRARGL